MNGGKPLCQLLADAAGRIVLSMAEDLAANGDALVLDVRERDAFAAGHIPGAQHLPRGQLELAWTGNCPIPPSASWSAADGEMATLAAATLRELGFGRAAVLPGRPYGLAGQGISPFPWLILVIRPLTSPA